MYNVQRQAHTIRNQYESDLLRMLWMHWNEGRTSFTQDFERIIHKFSDKELRQKNRDLLAQLIESESNNCEEFLSFIQRTRHFQEILRAYTTLTEKLRMEVHRLGGSHREFQKEFDEISLMVNQIDHW